MDPRLHQWVSYRPSINRVRPSYPGKNPSVSPYSGNTQRITRPVSPTQPAQPQQPRRGCCGGRR